MILIIADWNITDSTEPTTSQNDKKILTAPGESRYSQYLFYCQNRKTRKVCTTFCHEIKDDCYKDLKYQKGILKASTPTAKRVLRNYNYHARKG